MTVRRLFTPIVVAFVLLSLVLPTCNGIHLPTRLVSSPLKSSSNNRGTRMPHGGTGGIDAPMEDFNSTAFPGNKTNIIQGYLTGIQDLGDATKKRCLRVWRKANQRLAGIPAKSLIGARSVLCDYHLAAELRYTLAVNLFLCFGLRPALYLSNFGSIVRRRLSSALLKTKKYSTWTLRVIQIVSLAAWGFKTQDRLDRGLEAFCLPTILSYVYYKVRTYLFNKAFQFSDVSPFWFKALMGPISEEIEYRLLLSSLGIRTTASNKKRFVIRDATKASTNNMSLGTSWFIDLLFGTAHIGPYIPIVDPIQAGEDANRLIVGYNTTWNMGLFQKLYSNIIDIRSQMNNEQIVEASRLATLAFLMSRRVFGPVFEKRGVWASIGAHSMRNAIGGKGMEYLGLLQLLYGAYTRELPLKDSLAIVCMAFGTVFLDWVTKKKYLY